MFRPFFITVIIMAIQIRAEKPVTGQYNQKTITILQTMNGSRYLSQGGPAFVDYIVQGIDLNNKQVLDFGSGLCGPAMHLAKNYGAVITGVEVDPELIEGARADIS